MIVKINYEGKRDGNGMAVRAVGRNVGGGVAYSTWISTNETTTAEMAVAQAGKEVVDKLTSNTG